MTRRELDGRVRAAMPRWLAALVAWGTRNERRRNPRHVRSDLWTCVGHAIAYGLASLWASRWGEPWMVAAFSAVSWLALHAALFLWWVARAVEREESARIRRALDTWPGEGEG